MSDLLNKVNPFDGTKYQRNFDFLKQAVGVGAGALQACTPTAAELNAWKHLYFKVTADVETANVRIEANNSFYRATPGQKEILIRQLLLHRGNDSASEFALAKENLMKALGKAGMPVILQALVDKTAGGNMVQHLVEELLQSFSREVVGEPLDENFNLKPLLLQTLDEGLRALDTRAHEFLKYEGGSLVMSVTLSKPALPKEDAIAVEFIVPVNLESAVPVLKQLLKFTNTVKVTAYKAPGLAKAAPDSGPLAIFSKAVWVVNEKIAELYGEAHHAKDLAELSKIVERINRLGEAYNDLIKVLSTKNIQVVREKKMLEVLKRIEGILDEML